MKILLVSLILVAATQARVPPPPNPDQILASSEFDAILKRHGFTLNEKLDDTLPGHSEDIAALHGEFKDCYDQSVGVARSRSVSIFRHTVGDIVKGYIMQFPELFQVPERIVYQRLYGLLSNLKPLTQELIDCAHARAAGNPYTVKGLTSMSIYGPKAFENTLLSKSMSTYFAADGRGARLGDSGRVCSPFPSQGSENDTTTTPVAYDWNALGFVTPIYQQGSCESCYVFSTTSALESQYMIRVRKEPRPHFSVQTTLNCMPYSCQGGELPQPLSHMVKVGVTWEKLEPYVSWDWSLWWNPTMPSCKPPKEVALKADTYCYHENLTDTQIELLIKNGPAAAAVNAKHFKFVKGPFLDYCPNDYASLNHAVLIVGWTDKYWVIKNSWGTGWGVDGYLYLPKGENKCGINRMFGQPIVYPRISPKSGK